MPWTHTTYGRGFTACQRTINLLDGGQANIQVDGWQTDDGQVERTVAYDIPLETTSQDAPAISAAIAKAVTHA